MESIKQEQFECSAVTRWIEIELTNYCWMWCIVCPRKQMQNFWFMDFNTFKKIVELVKKWNYEEIMICGLWDAFLHKDLFKFIDYLFEKLPKINLFFMTKWQAITDIHLKKLLEYKNKGFNVSLTFSVFSLNKKIFNYLTWWDFYDNFIKMLLKVHKLKINYSLEFMLSTLTLWELEKFKVFAKSLNKDFWISLVHNWAGSIWKEIHKSLFDIKKLDWFYEKRKKEDICEVMKYDYLFIDYQWDAYQCSLNYSRNYWKLGSILENSLENLLNKKNNLDYTKNCENCFYFNYKTFN